MRLLILTILLSSCSMIHKTTDKHIKDSTAKVIDQSKIFTTSDSLHSSKTNTIETSDLVVVFKDTATGFVSISGDSISIPAIAIKEIRQKNSKNKKNDNTTHVVKGEAIINDKQSSVTVKEKNVSTEKKSFKVSWLWVFVIIATILLYMYRKRIYAIFKAFTIG